VHEAGRSPGRGRRGVGGKAAVVLAFAAGLAAFLLLGGADLLDPATLEERRDLLRAWADRRPVLAPVAAAAVYMAAVALSIPGATVLSLAAGFLFGRWLGTAVIVVAATAGAALVFTAARYVAGDWARARLGDRGRRLLRGFERDAFHWLLFLRLVPAFPFWAVNLAPALTGVSLRTFVAATALGILPGSFVFANLGEALGRIRSTDDLLSPQILLALALLGLLALVPVALRRLRGRRPETSENA
jgi:uncharacterized membrane protein YdjX (TVP38/TMEM64 family)